MIQLRCKYCGRLLMKIRWGRGEIKCGRCSRIVNFDVTTQTLDKFLNKLEDRHQEVAK